MFTLVDNLFLIHLQYEWFSCLTFTLFRSASGPIFCIFDFFFVGVVGVGGGEKRERFSLNS